MGLVWKSREFFVTVFFFLLPRPLWAVVRGAVWLPGKDSFSVKIRKTHSWDERRWWWHHILLFQLNFHSLMWQKPVKTHWERLAGDTIRGVKNAKTLVCLQKSKVASLEMYSEWVHFSTSPAYTESELMSWELDSRNGHPTYLPASSQAPSKQQPKLCFSSANHFKCLNPSLSSSLT